MILKGVVERMGGGKVDGKYETVDALEVQGYPEFRTLRGTSYVMDHLRSSIGGDAVVAITNHILIAVKRNGRVYSETGWKTTLRSGGMLIALLILGLIIAGFVSSRVSLILAPLLFLALYIRLKWMVSRVARA